MVNSVPGTSSSPSTSVLHPFDVARGEAFHAGVAALERFRRDGESLDASSCEDEVRSERPVGPGERRFASSGGCGMTRSS
jgi:hypothetical protein